MTKCPYNLPVNGLQFGTYFDKESRGFAHISTIGKRLKAIRKAKSMTQQALSDLLGIKRGTIANVESSGNKPPYEMVVAISTKITDISIDWFLTGEGEMYRTAVKAPVTKEVAAANDAISQEQRKLLETFDMLTDAQKREVVDAIESKRQMNLKFVELHNEIMRLKADNNNK